MKKISKIIFPLFIAVFMISCAKSDANLSNTTGTAGSLARFAVVDNFLYTVSSTEMNVFDISTESNPNILQKINLGWGIETIFPKDTLLFLGSMDGMHVYNIKNPRFPTFVSSYTHMVSCDPVVVNDTLAFITLHSNEGDEDNFGCGRNVNELHIVDIKDLNNPNVLNIYPMTRPMGLGLSGDTLYVCDDGLKIFDVSNPLDITLLNDFNIQAFDIIILQNHIIVVGEDGLYQYKIENQNITFLSKIEICNSNTLP
jgi:hypothetical protein